LYLPRILYYTKGSRLMATGGYGQGYPAYPGPIKREVRFDAINEAWDLFRQEMGTWVIAMLFALGIVAGAYFAVALLMGLLFAAGGTGRPGAGDIFAAGFFMSMILTMVLMLIVWGFLYSGLIHMAVKQVRGQPITFSDIFAAGSVVPTAIAATLIVGIASWIASWCLIIPGIIVSGLLMLTMPLVVDARYSAVQACQASWDALKQDWIKAACLYFVLQLVGGVGVLACGVGLLFTMPLVFLATAVVYRDFFLTQPAPYQAGPPLAPPMAQPMTPPMGPPGPAYAPPLNQPPAQQAPPPQPDFLTDEPPPSPPPAPGPR
jgi:hypothetical protein